MRILIVVLLPVALSAMLPVCAKADDECGRVVTRIEAGCDCFGRATVLPRRALTLPVPGRPDSAVREARRDSFECVLKILPETVRFGSLRESCPELNRPLFVALKDTASALGDVAFKGTRDQFRALRPGARVGFSLRSTVTIRYPLTAPPDTTCEWSFSVSELEPLKRSWWQIWK